MDTYQIKQVYPKNYNILKPQKYEIDNDKYSYAVVKSGLLLYRAKLFTNRRSAQIYKNFMSIRLGYKLELIRLRHDTIKSMYACVKPYTVLRTFWSTR